MEKNDFVMWLHGFSELNGETPPTKEQWKMIQEHLATMFEKVTTELEPAQAIPNKFTEIEMKDIFKPKGDAGSLRGWGHIPETVGSGGKLIC